VISPSSANLNIVLQRAIVRAGQEILIVIKMKTVKLDITAEPVMFGHFRLLAPRKGLCMRNVHLISNARTASIAGTQTPITKRLRKDFAWKCTAKMTDSSLDGVS
jgi:hypothetical protein